MPAQSDEAPLGKGFKGILETEEFSLRKGPADSSSKASGQGYMKTF